MMGDNFDMDADFDWDEGPNMNRFPSPGNYFRNDRYSNAYGNYRGGYGPGGGFAPPRGFGPNPRMYGPPGPPGPPGPRGPPFIWGRGFGPRGPPARKSPMDDRAVRYLIRCGVTKENLKNLPKELLQMIEPQHCGLCAQSFDSFNLSRMHYISKNHLKNQKKWLSKQSDGIHRSKEIPFKSRELYCELCDVHITSKVHADSHYAGKPHRAIVEGRKLPKNPVLLQRGREARLEQLVRREKKFLKNVDDVHDKDADTDMKPVPPELYCNICKTSVTCSEQMTMHMNGKRHLTKEKQHILKMMKGDVAEPDNQEAAEEAANAEQNENVDDGNGSQDNDGENEDGDQENFDWGTGTEKWEETATSNTE